ncbi:hypothetical protein IMSAGC022_00735 [Alistipes sp.]|nr:hypothetical protein IMSAGC022_00735 [Alistipes sp.]
MIRFITVSKQTILQIQLSYSNINSHKNVIFADKNQKK